MARSLAVLAGLLLVTCTETVRPKDPDNCLKIVYGQGEDRRALTAKAVRIISDKRVEAIDVQRRTDSLGLWWRASGNIMISGDHVISEGRCSGY